MAGIAVISKIRNRENSVLGVFDVCFHVRRLDVRVPAFTTVPNFQD